MSDAAWWTVYSVQVHLVTVLLYSVIVNELLVILEAPIHFCVPCCLYLNFVNSNVQDFLLYFLSSYDATNNICNVPKDDGDLEFNELLSTQLTEFKSFSYFYVDDGKCVSILT